MAVQDRKADEMPLEQADIEESCKTYLNFQPDFFHCSKTFSEAAWNRVRVRKVHGPGGAT